MSRHKIPSRLSRPHSRSRQFPSRPRSGHHLVPTVPTAFTVSPVPHTAPVPTVSPAWPQALLAGTAKALYYSYYVLQHTTLLLLVLLVLLLHHYYNTITTTTMPPAWPSTLLGTDKATYNYYYTITTTTMPPAWPSTLLTRHR